MTDTKPTICWNCNSSYSITDAKCPSCEAHNANVNIDAANLQERNKRLERELAAIKSQPVPVEPTMLAAMRLVGNAPEVIDYIDSLLSQLQVAQQELEVQMVGWSDCEEKLTKAEERNKQLVELVEHAKTQFQAYLNGPCTFTKSRTSTDCGCVSCTTRNAMNDLLREVGK